jgi:hypothetical protein
VTFCCYNVRPSYRAEAGPQTSGRVNNNNGSEKKDGNVATFSETTSAFIKSNCVPNWCSLLLVYGGGYEGSGWEMGGDWEHVQLSQGESLLDPRQQVYVRKTQRNVEARNPDVTFSSLLSLELAAVRELGNTIAKNIGGFKKFSNASWFPRSMFYTDKTGGTTCFLLHTNDIVPLCDWYL